MTTSTALLIGKLAIVLVLLVGTFVLVGLGRVEWKDATLTVGMLSSSLIVALGLTAVAKSNGKDDVS